MVILRLFLCRDKRDKKASEFKTKLTAVATKFEKSAREFKDAADAFQGQATSAGLIGPKVTAAITAFKAAAEKLGDDTTGGAAKFKLLVAEKPPALLKVCAPVLRYQLVMLRAKTREFEEKAAAFKEATGDPLVHKFKAAALDFVIVAIKFQQIAEIIHAMISTASNQLKPKSQAFKDQVDSFAKNAGLFYRNLQSAIQAKEVTGTLGNNIQDAFNATAGKFGLAVNDFYEAIKALVGQQ